MPLVAPTDRPEPVTIPSLPSLTELKELPMPLPEAFTMPFPLDF
jgi:hypothetical protein